MSHPVCGPDGESLAPLASIELEHSLGAGPWQGEPPPLSSNPLEFIRNSVALIQAACREGRADLALAREELCVQWTKMMRTAPLDRSSVEP